MSQPPKALVKLASQMNVAEGDAYSIMSKTIMAAKNNQQPTPEEILVFTAVASEYGLNPITKEIYAFNNRGAIQPIVSVDGWIKIINNHPQLDGIQFESHFNDGKLVAITCKIYRKDRKHPVEVPELLDECFKSTEPWKKWPARMLRHKALIQAARIAFGFSGIVDPDEADNIKIALEAEEGQQAPAATLEAARAAYQQLQSKVELRVFLADLKKTQPLIASQLAREIVDYANTKPETLEVIETEFEEVPL